MQDRGDEEVDLERMSDGYESDESPLPPVDNPCNGLKRQENIGNAQVFQSKPKTCKLSTVLDLSEYDDRHLLHCFMQCKKYDLL